MSTPLIAPALSNAVMQLTGVRLRHAPFTSGAREEGTRIGADPEVGMPRELKSGRLRAVRGSFIQWNLAGVMRRDDQFRPWCRSRDRRPHTARRAERYLHSRRPSAPGHQLLVITLWAERTREIARKRKHCGRSIQAVTCSSSLMVRCEISRLLPREQDRGLLSVATTRPPRDSLTREQNNPVVVVAVQSNPVEGCQEYFMSRQSRASALAEPAPARNKSPAETEGFH